VVWGFEGAEARIAAVSVDVVFETHSWSVDNDRGVASGWLDGPLSERGRLLAAELGDRRRSDDFACVFTSDLRRAVETAEIAFAGTDTPIIEEWRLRECNYGALNGVPRARMDVEGPSRIDDRHPDGESWQEAILRVEAFLRDLMVTREGERVLIIGHMSAWYALEHLVNGIPLSEVWQMAFRWREGWSYRLSPPPDSPHLPR
jgi:2,3-bisphosphoglycerate-dependent phosphoglycerate mutase